MLINFIQTKILIKLFIKKVINYTEICFNADSKVFNNNMLTVIGPTPPGTGVIKPAILLASIKSTSPVIVFSFDSTKNIINLYLKSYFFFLVLINKPLFIIGFIPQSITIEPF